MRSPGRQRVECHRALSARGVPWDRRMWCWRPGSARRRGGRAASMGGVRTACEKLPRRVCFTPDCDAGKGPHSSCARTNTRGSTSQHASEPRSSSHAAPRHPGPFRGSEGRCRSQARARGACSRSSGPGVYTACRSARGRCNFSISGRCARARKAHACEGLKRFSQTYRNQSRCLARGSDA